MNTTKMIATIVLAVIISILVAFGVYTGIAAVCLWIASTVFEFEYTIWHVFLGAAVLEVFALTFKRGGSDMGETIKKYIEEAKRRDTMKKIHRACGTVLNNIDTSRIVDVDIVPDNKEAEHNKYLKTLNDCTDAVLNGNETKPQEAGISLDKLHYAIPGYPMLEEYEEDIMPPRFYGKE